MSRENRTPTGQVIEVGDRHHSGESATEGEDNLPRQKDKRDLCSSNYTVRDDVNSNSSERT